MMRPSRAACPYRRCRYEKLVEQARYKARLLRTSRPNTPVIYNNDENFPIGGANVLTSPRQGHGCRGVDTLSESLKALTSLPGGVNITVIDANSVKPLGSMSLCGRSKNRRPVLTV